MNDALQRSAFVTVLSWIFITLSGFATAMSVLQNVMFHTVFNDPQIIQEMQNTPPDMSPLHSFIFTHLHLLALAGFLVSAIVLASSIGLLKRKNWARKIFICLMALGILWNLGCGIAQVLTFSSIQGQFAAAPNAPDMSTFFITTAVVGLVFIVGFSILFGWIAKRLMSPEIVAEFYTP